MQFPVFFSSFLYDLISRRGGFDLEQTHLQYTARRTWFALYELYASDLLSPWNGCVEWHLHVALSLNVATNAGYGAGAAVGEGEPSEGPSASLVHDLRLCTILM